jgi:prepilin-type N-terminal cleavage/methylation domain-containing protein
MKMCRSHWVIHTADAGHGSRGFTFLEILIALWVVLIALVPLIHLHVASIRMIDSSSHMAQAALLANDRLAEILARETSDLGKSGGHVEDANDGTVYRWTVVVTDARPPETESLPLSGLRHVHVEAVWQDGGRDVVVSLDTYIHVARASEREILENKNYERNSTRTARPPRRTL